MGTNGTPLASHDSCSINYTQDPGIDRAYRYWTQLPRTSLRECQPQQYRLVAYFPNLTLMILLHHHTHPAPTPTPFLISQDTRIVIMDFSGRHSRGGVVKCGDWRKFVSMWQEISQFYWCIHRPVVTFASGSPRRDPSSKNGFIGVMLKGPLPGL